MKNIRFLLIILAFIFISCGSLTLEKEIPRAERGVLDLTEWDINKDGVISLDGEWEFYWERLLGPVDFNAEFPPAPSGFFETPKEWNKYDMNGVKLPQYGYATYRLTVRINETNKMYGLKINNLSTAFKLWVNEKFIASAGVVGTNQQGTIPRFQPRIVFFKGDDRDIELVLQIANYHYNKPGFIHSIKMGNQEDIIDLREKGIFIDMFIAGGVLIFGLIYIIFFFFRRKERSFILFGIYTFLFFIRNIVIGENILTQLVPSIPWEVQMKLELLPFYIGSIIFLEFIYHVFKNSMSRKIAWGIQLTFMPSILATLFLPARYYLFLREASQLIFILGSIYVIYVLIKEGAAKKKENNGAFVALIGFLLLYFSIFNDILHYLSISPIGKLAPYGYFVFIFSLSVVMAMRFSKAFTNEEKTSKKLSEQKLKLETAYSEIEKKIKERTKTILEDAQEIEIQRNKLRLQNEELKRDMEMAKKLQMNLIPSKSPSPNISFYYKPMALVGGDFFDFFEYDNMDLIGIFLSDVSGHGIPAAFITSMIKSFVLQFANVINDPGELLNLLNAFLINQIGTNFVTAFYGIFNKTTREFIFANAGHNQPYLITKNKIEQISSAGNGIPLGLYNNDELKDMKKDYKNNNVILSEVSKLFLYTDGLTEAVNIFEKDVLPDDRIYDFETLRLIPALLELKNYPSNKLIERMEKKLISFRGSDSFDDDVCMICLDIL